MQHGNTATKASVKPGLRKAYPVHATYRSYEIPQERWHELMLARRQFKNKLSHNCQCLIEFVNDANVMFAELGFENTEAMISYWYHLQPEEIAVAVEWLRLNPEDRPSSIWLAPIVPITINEDESLPLYSGDMRATYQASDVPRELWSELAHARWHFMELHFSADFRCLIEGVQDANAMFAELGFANVEAMIRDGYQLRPEQIALAMEWLRLNPQDEQPQQAYPPDPPTAEEIKHAEND